MEQWRRLCDMVLARQACCEAQGWWALASDRVAELGEIAAERRRIFQGVCAALCMKTNPSDDVSDVVLSLHISRAVATLDLRT